MNKAESATPGQGPSVVQPGAPGQGDPATAAGKGSDAGFNWQLFPDVPEEQRPLLEPHLRGVQGHVTRLEQSYAPFKPFLDAGLSQDQAQQLLQFAQDFDTDPQQVWLGMAQMLKENQHLDSNFDVDALTAMAQGQQMGEDPAAGEITPGAEADNPLQARVDQLEGMIQQMQEQAQQSEQQQMESQQDELLDQHLSGMASELSEAGVSDDLITETRLMGALIANQGDPQAAMQDLLGFRDGVLTGFTQGQTDNDGPKPPTMPRGAPPAPKKPTQNGGKQDPFKAVRAGAEQMLNRAAEADAQGQ